VKFNASDAIFSLIGFLTTREQPLILSKKHDPAPVAAIVQMFCDANKLPKTRENWPKRINPENTDHLTNVEPLKDCCRSYTAKEIADEIVKHLGQMPRKDWNEITGRVLTHVVKVYKEDLALWENQSDAAYKNRTECQQRQQELNNIVSGEIKFFL
jgi:hypothetical protein